MRLGPAPDALKFASPPRIPSYGGLPENNRPASPATAPGESAYGGLPEYDARP
jgi:hypothetical protein